MGGSYSCRQPKQTSIVRLYNQNVPTTAKLTIASLLSDTSLRRIEMVCRSGLPHREALPGCVVFCDISGFTKFIEASKNTEESTQTINRLLSLVARLAYHCGGDVLKFAGDAVLVLS